MKNGTCADSAGRQIPLCVTPFSGGKDRIVDQMWLHVMGGRYVLARHASTMGEASTIAKSIYVSCKSNGFAKNLGRAHLSAVGENESI
jgi:hypothetical protein